MSVVTAYEEAGPWRKKLTIEVPSPAVEAEMGRVVKDIARSVRLPGFRKGKAPASLIKKRFPEEVEQRLADRLVPRYVRQAVAEKSLDVLTEPRVEELDFGDGTMSFVVLVETRPQIELGDLDAFDLPHDPVDATDEEVADMIRDLRRQHATWEPVDREAATGDLVRGKVREAGAGGGGEQAEGEQGGGEAQPLRIEIGAKDVDEELGLALTGLKAGATTTFERKVQEGDELVEKRYEIEVEAVEEIHLPELDADFAKKLGDFDTVEALQEAVAQRIGAQKKMEVARKRERALLDQLRARHPLELPRGIVEKEIEHMLRDYAVNLSQQGIDLEKTPINWEALQEQASPEAERRVHERLVLDAVAEARGIKVDEEEFERVLADIARQQKKSSLAIRQELSASGRLPSLRAQMLRQRTVRHLLGEDTSTDNENDTDETSEKA